MSSDAIRDLQILLEGRRGHLMREAIRCHVIRCNQRSSDTPRGPPRSPDEGGNHMSSDAIRDLQILLEGRRGHLMREAIRCHQMQSEIFRYSSRAAAVT